jgi:hypothetical protein
MTSRHLIPSKTEVAACRGNVGFTPEIGLTTFNTVGGSCTAKAETQQSYIKAFYHCVAVRRAGYAARRKCRCMLRRNRKDLVTVSNLAASFAAVANCAIGSLSYLAICNGQMAGNWAPHPERHLLKERRRQAKRLE